MTIQELCAERKQKLGLTYQDIAAESGVPLSTVKKFFSSHSKAPAFFVVAGVCKVLGISIDAYVGIGDHLTADEKTLQAEKNGLEHRLENKREAMDMMWRGLRLRNHIIFTMGWIIIGLIAWCMWVDLHCADYGLWRW